MIKKYIYDSANYLSTPVTLLVSRVQMRAVCQVYSLLMMEAAADFKKANETNRDIHFKLLLGSAIRQFGNSHRKVPKEEDYLSCQFLDGQR